MAGEECQKRALARKIPTNPCIKVKCMLRYTHYSSRSDHLCFFLKLTSLLHSWFRFLARIKQLSLYHPLINFPRPIDILVYPRRNHPNSLFFLSFLFQRGLCCFPGFSNPSTTPRKGKISQPLLASVVGLENAGGFLGGLVRSDQQARPEEMLLLEKQGRSSQRQRMPEQERAGSLPPSSLPRPRRSRDRKLGEYGRLSDGETTRKTSTNSSGSEEHVIGKGTPPRPPATPKIEYTRFGEVRKTSNDSGKIEFPRFGEARKTPPLDTSNFGRYDSQKNSRNTSQGKLEYSRFCEPRKTPSIESQNKLEFSRYNDGQTTPPAESSPKTTVKKSFIPHPRKLGEYGRLSDGKGSSARTSTDSTQSVRGPRDSGDSGTGASTSSEQSKVRLFSPSSTRRGSSLSRETPSGGKYRIQF